MKERERSGEFKSGLALGQTTPRESALISFLNATLARNGDLGVYH